MITNRLRDAIEHVGELSPESQDIVAALIEEQMSDALWERLLADPRGLATLQHMADEADKQPFVPIEIPEDIMKEVEEE
jgi:hypothetical protein